MNFFLLLILIIIVGDYILDIVVETLNVRSLKTDLPHEFEGSYDALKYKKSQEYLKETTRFGIFIDSITTPLTIAFILLGGFNLVDQLARSFSQNPYYNGPYLCRYTHARLPTPLHPFLSLQHFRN